MYPQHHEAIKPPLQEFTAGVAWKIHIFLIPFSSKQIQGTGI